MATVSLREFFESGRFGPIALGATRSAIEKAFGVPEDVDSESLETARPPVIMKYSDVELHFDPDSGALCLIHIDRFSGPGRAPMGWGGCQLEPWVITERMPRSELERALELADLPYTIEPKPELDQQWLVSPSGAMAGFATDPSDAGRLAYLSLGIEISRHTMVSAVEFHYELTGAGWSECRFAIGEVRCELSASYLSDALGDLASAVEDVLRWPGVDARAVFVEEPGEYRWRFVAAGADRVRVRILMFSDWGHEGDEGGKTIFDAECSRRSLGEAVAAELRRLREVHGARGYRKKWVNNDFPAARLSAIEELLASC